MPTDTNHRLVFLGALLFIIGVFLPLASIPVVGDISYYRVDNMSAIIVVLLWPALKNMGGGSDDGGMLGDLMGKATDPLADFASKLFTNINDFSWGGFIFLIGLLVLTAGGIMTTLKARK